MSISRRMSLMEADNCKLWLFRDGLFNGEILGTFNVPIVNKIATVHNGYNVFSSKVIDLSHHRTLTLKCVGIVDGILPRNKYFGINSWSAASNVNVGVIPLDISSITSGNLHMQSADGNSFSFSELWLE